MPADAEYDPKAMPNYDEDTVTLQEWVNAACGAVVEAMQAGSVERKEAVARSINEVEQQLPAELDDLAVFLRALRQLLAGQSPAAVSQQLTVSYADVFDRVVDSAWEDSREVASGHHHHDGAPAHSHTEPEGRRMGLGEVLDEIVQDTVRVIQQGGREDRLQMAQGLEVLRMQAHQAMEWPAFAEFLQALQALLRDDPLGRTEFEPPFDQAWTRISDQLSVNSNQ